MFDWNDEELTNIIWGEAGETDDHIVPYPDQIEEKPSNLFGDPLKKETKQKTSNTSPPEQKNPPTKAEHGVELESNTKYDTDGTAQFKKDSEIFDIPPEDGEHGDFVDYGWANIGSFDDLDRIFSNQDPIFGDMSVGHADELWSPSKDVTRSPLGTTTLSGDSSDLPFGAALRSSIDQSEIKVECMLDVNQPFISGYKKLNEATSHATQDVQTPSTGGRTQAHPSQLNDGTVAAITGFPGKLFSCVQADMQKRSLKSQKSDKKNKVRQLHNLSGTWTSTGSTLQQLNNQYALPVINPGPPLLLTQQSTLSRPESFQQKYFPSAPLGTPLYGNMVNHYPMASVLPQLHPGDENHELMSSSYEVQPSNSNSVKNSEDAAAKPPPMTPKEKIEKIRRRQQMRAILAIQKQQLQFGNQVSVFEHSGMEGGKSEVNESLGTFPSLEPNSPAEQYDSNTISMTFDNCSVEESVLCQLQDTISKLDIQIKLCIRDSLFRLAQSAVQRQQYHNDTCSTNTSSKDEVLSNKDIVSHERFTRMPDVETDTNPIDRTVAHLLFHRPLEISGKPADAPDSPLSANLPPYEKKAILSESLTKGYSGESLRNTQITSPQGSKTAGIFSEGNQSKNGTAFFTCENVSNKENTDGVQAKVETSS